jgi:hypothetical protein
MIPKYFSNLLNVCANVNISLKTLNKEADFSNIVKHILSYNSLYLSSVKEIHTQFNGLVHNSPGCLKHTLIGMCE